MNRTFSLYLEKINEKDFESYSPYFSLSYSSFCLNVLRKNVRGRTEKGGKGGLYLLCV